jgi:hypothetical protein
MDIRSSQTGLFDGFCGGGGAASGWDADLVIGNCVVGEGRLVGSGLVANEGGVPDLVVVEVAGDVCGRAESLEDDLEGPSLVATSAERSINFLNSYFAKMKC